MEGPFNFETQPNILRVGSKSFPHSLGLAHGKSVPPGLLSWNTVLVRWISRPSPPGVTFLSLGLGFTWFPQLFLSVMKQEVTLRALGCCCTKWYFAEYIEATQVGEHICVVSMKKGIRLEGDDELITALHQCLPEQSQV